MAFLYDARQAIKTALEEDDDLNGKVHTSVPSPIQPPCVVIAPHEPYIEEGITYRDCLVNYDVLVFAKPGPNDKVANDLDILVEKVFTKLQLADGFTVTSVPAPGSISTTNTQYLACALVVKQRIDLLIEE